MDHDIRFQRCVFGVIDEQFEGSAAFGVIPRDWLSAGTTSQIGEVTAVLRPCETLLSKGNDLPNQKALQRLDASTIARSTR